MIEPADVCVAGAGPAGSAIAARLAGLGYDVVLVEAQEFPRPHVGICLSDETLPVLAEIGVWNEVEEAGFHRRRATRVRWPSPGDAVVENRGLHVDRGAFDSILMRAARNRGASVLRSRVTSAIRSTGGWRVSLTTAPSVAHLDCRFLVDATGRRGVLKHERLVVSPPLFAMHAQWELSSAPEQDGWVEALDAAWCWFAQTAPDTALVSIFVDPRSLRRTKRAVESHYHALLESSLLARSLPLRSRTSPVRGCDATSQAVENPVGEDFIAVGDACMTVDPVASQGVHLALVGSLAASSVTNTILRFPEDREHARAFYRGHQEERLRSFSARTAETYGQVAALRPDAFWHERASHLASRSKAPARVDVPAPSTRLVLSPLVEVRSTPVLDHDRIRCGPALFHPGLDRPTAYLGGAPIVELLAELASPVAAGELVRRWTRALTAGVAVQALGHLWRCGIVEPAA